MNKTVIDILKTIPKNEKVYYRSNPGNAGDALIAAGTFQVFDELNLDLEFIKTIDFNSEGKIVIYAGGGNLNHIYSDARNFIEKTHQEASMFILLPHTITSNEDLIANMGSNCIIFAREKVSFEHICKYKKDSHTFIDDDMALHLDVQKILSKNYPNSLGLFFKKFIKCMGGRDVRREIPSTKRLIKISLFEFKSHFLKSKKVGLFFRSDVEAVSSQQPDGNFDLSIIYAFGTKNRPIIEYTVWRLLRYINQFERIETDRLHISVGSALLNKPTKFYPNSYFKCKAVYEYSLSKKFSSISWQEKIDID